MIYISITEDDYIILLISVMLDQFYQESFFQTSKEKAYELGNIELVLKYWKQNRFTLENKSCLIWIVKTGLHLFFLWSFLQSWVIYSMASFLQLRSRGNEFIFYLLEETLMSPTKMKERKVNFLQLSIKHLLCKTQ